MKKIITCIILVVVFQYNALSQPQPGNYPHDINYFIPEGNYSFNQQIPLPKAVLGFEIGQQHADWNNVLEYMKALDSASDRVSIKQFGRTNQFRPFIQVAITSERNQKNLENIRQEHLQLTDANNSKKLDISKMPVVVNLMYTIHGNEPSGVNSALVVAYYLAALQGAEIENLLDNMVIVLTPGLNPDGINRFASWVNSSRSFPDVADLSSREFSEPWPSSRTNHYWADCNRDWLMAQQDIGRNALEMYFEWVANVVCDFHEQGGDRSYYFSPGHPKRTHPRTPQLNQDLTSKLTAYSAKTLDKIGTLYYSKEGYDDYYYGKGAAYGDIHGSVSILYEQLASRGHLRPTRNFGDMSFASTIRNQAFSGISVLQGALALKKELLEYQRNYYQDIKDEAGKDPIQAYIFNARGSKAIAYHFLENLKRHRIDVYRLAKKQTIDGKNYNPDDSYIIPVNQKYYSTVKTLMENVTEFQDSTFYDISTWTFPHAYNLQYDELKSVSGLLGEKIEKPEFPVGKVLGGKSTIAYIFENTQYYTPKLIVELLKNNLIVKVGSKPFTCPNNGKPLHFGYGTILVPAQYQPLKTDEIHRLISRLAAECGVDVYAVNQGLMTDFDLGSPSFTPISLPKVAVIVGSGMGIPESGEVWMMLGQRFQMPPVLIDYNNLGSTDLNKYNVLVMADGTPTRALSQAVTDKITNWVDAGGILVATGSAYTWTNKAKLTDIKTIPAAKVDSSGYKSYASRLGATAGNAVDGVILNCRLDPTHPLAYGYTQEKIAVFRTGSVAFERAKSAYVSPLSYLKTPYLSGCISPANLQRIAGSPAIITKANGKGQVIVFADDMNFRMYWYGTTKLFMNAILFGQLL
ncbi:peptidase M14 [Bacteroidia bacterium]|nr:peptidase M14 [Bacteroidia bacterium]